MNRESFKLFVSIEKEWVPREDIMYEHPGYEVDNVIQLKLTKESFIDLFRDSELTTSDSSNRYSSRRLLQRLELFFNRQIYHNHNTLASDVTILINNTHNDIDINPINLENACSTNGQIFNYFFKSDTIFNNHLTTSHDNLGLYDDDTTSHQTLRVYEIISRELDNMISRNLFSLGEDNNQIPDNSYDDLDALYTIYENSFWENIQIGDSVFIEGSFQLPNDQSLSVIIQFVCTNFDVYQTNNYIQSLQESLTLDSSYDM